MSRLIDQCSLGLVVCTMGADGALLVTADEVVRVLAKPAVLVDTVGAGDAFTATLVAGMLRGLSLEMAGDRAASVAAFVCSRAGATPELPDEFRLGGTLPPHQETVDGSERMVGDAAGA
jgi:fructokinase